MGRKCLRGAPGATSVKAESQPEQFGVEKKYGSGHAPGNDGDETRIDEFPIFERSLVKRTSGITAKGN